MNFWAINPRKISLSRFRIRKGLTAACCPTSLLCLGMRNSSLVSRDEKSMLCLLILDMHSSWRPQIPFTLLFGIATSIDLLESRLLKSACRLIYGAQFDCVQTETILENVFKGAVISSDVPLRLGPQILRGMLDRQRDHMAGIQAFISSLKVRLICGLKIDLEADDGGSTFICAIFTPTPSASYWLQRLKEGKKSYKPSTSRH